MSRNEPDGAELEALLSRCAAGDRSALETLYARVAPILLAVLPLAFLLRDTVLYRRTFMPAGSAAIVLLAGYWLVARMTGTGLG